MVKWQRHHLVRLKVYKNSKRWTGNDQFAAKHSRQQLPTLTIKLLVYLSHFLTQDDNTLQATHIENCLTLTYMHTCMHTHSRKSHRYEAIYQPFRAVAYSRQTPTPPTDATPRATIAWDFSATSPRRLPVSYSCRALICNHKPLLASRQQQLLRQPQHPKLRQHLLMRPSQCWSPRRILHFPLLRNN